jgi:hypothetical protein
MVTSYPNAIQRGYYPKQETVFILLPPLPVDATRGTPAIPEIPTGDDEKRIFDCVGKGYLQNDEKHPMQNLDLRGQNRMDKQDNCRLTTQERSDGNTTSRIPEESCTRGVPLSKDTDRRAPDHAIRSTLRASILIGEGTLSERAMLPSAENGKNQQKLTRQTGLPETGSHIFPPYGSSFPLSPITMCLKVPIFYEKNPVSKASSI